MNISSTKDYKNRRRSARRAAKTAFVVEKKSVPCMDCAKRFHFASMQFDHVVGDKKFNLADGPRREVSDDRLREEIDKCEIVCANCHHLRTFARLKNLDIETFFKASGLTYRGYLQHSRRSNGRLLVAVSSLVGLAIGIYLFPWW